MQRRDHQAYDVSPPSESYMDDKDADLDPAYRSGSSSSTSASAPLMGSPVLPSSSSAPGSRPTPVVARLNAVARGITRRALLAVLVGLAVVVTVLSAASSERLGDGQVLEHFRSAKELVQQEVADRWAALKWHNGQEDDAGLEFDQLDVLSVRFLPLFSRLAVRC